MRGIYVCIHIYTPERLKTLNLEDEVCEVFMSVYIYTPERLKTLNLEDEVYEVFMSVYIYILQSGLNQ